MAPPPATPPPASAAGCGGLAKPMGAPHDPESQKSMSTCRLSHAQEVVTKAMGQCPEGGRHSPAGSSRPCSAHQTPLHRPGAPTPAPHRKTRSPHPRCTPSGARPALPGASSGPPVPLPPPGSVELMPLRLQVVEREVFYKENQAASTIQRAWKRFHIRCRLKEALRRGDKGAESVETATSLLVRLLWDRHPNSSSAPPKATPPTEHHAPPSKATAKKTTVLQTIYGGSQARRGRPTRSTTLNSRSHSQILLDLSLGSNTHLNTIECVHLLDAVDQARQFSYHMRPSSVTRGAKSRGKR